MKNDPVVRRDLIHLMNNREKLSQKQFSEIFDDIVRLEGCGWEMGPAPRDFEKTILALSSFGNKMTLDRISREIGLPVYGEHWSFIIGIPPRIWEQYFEYIDSNGKQYKVEGTNWHYRLSDETGRVQILVDSYPDHYDDICDDLARILCVGELGENNIIDFVSKISCVKLEAGEGKPLCYLRNEFSNRFTDCHYKSVLDEASITVQLR